MPIVTRAKSKRGKNHYWAVAKGRQPGIFSTWAEAELQVCKFNGHSHAGFPTLDAAIEFMRKGG